MKKGNKVVPYHEGLVDRLQHLTGLFIRIGNDIIKEKGEAYVYLELDRAVYKMQISIIEDCLLAQDIFIPDLNKVIVELEGVVMTLNNAIKEGAYFALEVYDTMDRLIRELGKREDLGGANDRKKGS